MGKTKASSKKQQKRGVDFNKIKRKIGRKLPPPKNTTNTEIKFKAIILPEQSVASEKAGVAVSKQRMTLKEHLQQTCHYNPKVRKDALIGIRDIFKKYPTELRLHKLAVIEKLRERINDDDKMVRETLYQLLKSVIFPGCTEDNQGPFISLMMAYIFNAMTHLSIDIRLMAFDFLYLVVQHYPSSFSLYAQKIFENYEDTLRKNQFYLQDKGKLKNVLAGLVHCLLLLPSTKVDNNSPIEKDHPAPGLLHAFEPDIAKDPAGFSVISIKLKDLVPVLVSCFQDHVRMVHTTTQLDAQSFDCMLSILQNIDLIVRFFANEIDNSQEMLQVCMMPYIGFDATIRGQTIQPLLLKKLLDLFPLNTTHHHSVKEDEKYFVLNVMITVIFLRQSDWPRTPDILLERVLEFFTSALTGEICSGKVSGKTLHEKHLRSLIPFIPKLVWQVTDYWKSRILQAFTKIFKSCNLEESSLKWACLSAAEEMLVPRQGLKHLDPSDPELVGYQITWIRELPLLLMMLGDKNPLRSRCVLSLLLRLGQCAVSNTSIAQEYDNTQYSLAEFYCRCTDEGDTSYGPFVKLDRDAQELSICSLYYLSFVDSLLLKSLASCCLYEGLEPLIIFRVIEVVHSAFKVGHIQIASHISFFITLVSRFNVFPDKSYPTLGLENNESSNRGTFKSITSIVCSCLLQMGDDFFVFQILEKVVIDQILLTPDLDNSCALLRMLVALDSNPTRLSQKSIDSLSRFLPEYLTVVVSCFPEDDAESPAPVPINTGGYYLLPCYFLIYRCDNLLNHVLDKMGSWVTEKMSSPFSRAADKYSCIGAIVSVIQLMHKDDKIRKILSSCKAEITLILQSVLVVQSSEEISMAIEERLKIQSAVDRLKTITSTSFSDGR